MNRPALRAAALIAAVYGHFLIFAQFSFVELLRAAGAGVALERATLGTMAVAGIVGGFWAAWRGASSLRIRVALFAAAASAALAPLVGGAVSGMIVAMVTGGALGVATVGVSSLVRGWCGMAWVGLGTGVGYACCNLPWVFTQSPGGQAWIGSAMAIVGGLAVPAGGKWKAESEAPVLPWAAVVAMFAALVWLDSAAFFIIQHVAVLKAGTWGDGMHWRNAGIHLVVAVVAGWWMARGGSRKVPLVAWVLLAVAAVAVNTASSVSVAGWLYPAGVSLYSTALVIWPSWFGGSTDERKAGWRAAVLFAVAGWFASANGIGMAESLRRVPEWFVALSGCVVIGVTVFSKRGGVRAVVGVAVVLTAVVLGGIRSGKPAQTSAVARGRQVYLSEGCIHCHSQYLRPGALDEGLWGKAGKLEDVRKGVPVLIGNRRQGPDLATVGARRSAAWLREHFIDPQLLVPASPMPKYAGLFDDQRGADLIAYLQAAATEWSGDKVANAADWRPMKGREDVDPERGMQMFSKWCVACHGPQGKGDGPLAKRLVKPPVNLVAGPFLWTAATDQIELNTARVIKFGLLGTDMPGHEVLTDAQVMDLTAYVLGLRTAAK
jgi:cytochrome c oxidase cbb3-type subunit 2